MALVKDVPFLGFKILREKIRVSNKARLKFKTKVREFTRRNNPLSMYQTIQDLSVYLRDLEFTNIPVKMFSNCKKGGYAYEDIDFGSK